jgi:hypothetical protein
VAALPLRRAAIEIRYSVVEATAAKSSVNTVLFLISVALSQAHRSEMVVLN